MSFPKTIKVIQGRETGYPEVSYFHELDGVRRIAKTSKEINNPYSSVIYGPLLFAYPIPDQGPNTPQLTVPYNFALNLNPVNPEDKVKIINNDMPEHWHWQLNNPPIQIKVPASQFNWEPSALQPLPSMPVKNGEDTSIILVPYNLTKFRISMFPVNAASWDNK